MMTSWESVAEFSPAQTISYTIVNSPFMTAESKAVHGHILPGDLKQIVLPSCNSAIKRSWWDQDLNMKEIKGDPEILHLIGNSIRNLLHIHCS